MVIVETVYYLHSTVSTMTQRGYLLTLARVYCVRNVGLATSFGMLLLMRS